MSHKNSTVFCKNPPLEDLHLSPREEEEFAGTIIEGKKREPSSVSALLHQLMANMVVLVAKTLVIRVTSMSEETLLHDKVALDILSCYGIAYTGAGEFGLFKLQLNFREEKFTFIEKIPIQRFSFQATAALFDFTMDYISEKNQEHVLALK